LVKVAGIWERGWMAPITEFDLWAFPLRDFGVDEWIMTPVSGIAEKVTEFKNMGAVIEANSDLIPVYVDEKGETPLSQFEHPDNALYILGKAGRSEFRKGISVKIETKEDSGLLWPHQAICVVLYDRKSKAWL
jgi:hypothetical protein